VRAAREECVVEEPTQALLDEVERRWRTLFAELAAGADAPPAARLRLEGLLEAALLVGAASEAELTARMDVAYRQAFGESLAQRFGEDWRSFFPFPQVPAMMKRAPVVPSTRD
jgi:hypothetical protein